jgi:hypothetical protein
MGLAEAIIIAVCVLAVFLLIGIAIIYTKNYRGAIKDSQVVISDKDLIIFINSQPDKIVDRKLLMNEFGLSKFEAGGRLNHFFTNGLLQVMTSRSGLKRYYTLSRAIEKSFDLELTEDPFITVEDLLLIFKNYDYQVTLQEVCLSSGLPIKVILEEMKYFEKEKVIKCLLLRQHGGFSYQKVYTLCEPYRSNPDQFMNLQEEANLELKEIVKKINKV